MTKVFLRSLPISIIALGMAISAYGADSYSTGFESPDFVVGPMSDGLTTQGGWSGGAQAGFTNDNLGDEEITTNEAHSGLQSWHYARGYNSPGQGTPYSPNITAASNEGDVFTASLWFKASVGGDGSSVAIDTGNPTGDDRANIIAYITNAADGLELHSYTDSNFDVVSLYSGVDNSVWHHLTFSLTKSNYDDPISLSLDGGAAINFNGSLNSWRQSNSFDYSESSRLKFVARNPDQSDAYDGFYFDDISYSTTAVPEPASMAVLGLGALGVIRRRRNKRVASSS